MGDDEGYNDFEVREEVLLTGGGGAYEEPAVEDRDERQLNESRDDDDDDDDNDDDSEEAEEDEDEEEEEEDEEKARRLGKKRAKLTELKEKKKAKMEQMTVAGDGASKGLTAEEQFQLFMLHQTAGSGGLVAALAQSRFVAPLCTLASPDGQRNGSPFARAIEVCVGKSKLNKTSDEMGCPVVLILCAGAKRATTVINVLSKKIHCKISKLFAKHIKITEQVEVLAKHHYPIAVGTPNRVEKLLELGALCLRNIELIIVDMDQDAKHYTILNLPGVAEDFYKLVGNWVSKEAAKEASAIKVTLLS